MIKISCERVRLAEWEKIRYARALSVIIRELREFREAIKEEEIVEVDYQIIIK